MFRTKSIFVITSLSFILLSCREKAKKAKIYHDSIVQLTAVVTDSVIDYADAIHSGYKPLSIDVTNTYLNLIKRTIDSVNSKGSFEGDSSLSVSSIGLLSFYQNYITQNFKPFFYSIQKDSLSESEILIADSLHRKMMDDEVQYWNNFNNAEKKFSDTYDLMSLE